MKKINKVGEVFARIYRIVQKIPEGKVTTYGIIAEKLGIGARTVGWALHTNRNPDVPCHRVVNQNGRLATTFGMGGWQEQKRRLEAEGVKFKDENHVDLERYLWNV